jgi:hypothetical protein
LRTVAGFRNIFSNYEMHALTRDRGRSLGNI